MSRREVIRGVTHGVRLDVRPLRGYDLDLDAAADPVRLRRLSATGR
jgi:hypothetical protein